MTADSKESTAPCSATSRACCQATLSERLTPSLITLGLVKGTTLSFGARLCYLGTQAGVSFAPDGRAVELPEKGLLF